MKSRWQHILYPPLELAGHPDAHTHKVSFWLGLCPTDPTGQVVGGSHDHQAMSAQNNHTVYKQII